jgi:predicted ATP-grasp superfamily ATP-dependent carboligase
MPSEIAWREVETKARGVLVTGAPHVMVIHQGQLGVLPAMRALKRAGARVTLAIASTSPTSAGASRYADRVVLQPPLGDRCRFLEFAHDAARIGGVDVILPMGDPALVAMQPYRTELEAIVPVAAAPAASVAIAVDKAATIARARGVEGSLRVPVTTTPGSAAEAVATWRSRFPVLVKPRTGSNTVGIRIARDPAELQRTFELTASEHGPTLVQEVIDYRPGDKFVLLYLFDHRGELSAWYAQQIRVESRAISVGDGTVRHRGGNALLWRSASDPELLEKGRRLLSSLGWRGLAAIEGAFDRRDGQPYLFEINPRLDATSTLALSQGRNFAYDACLVALERLPPRRLDLVAGHRARKDLFTILAARELRPALALLDPRVRPPVPIRLDPVPFVREAARLLRKRRHGRKVMPSDA